MSSNEDYLDSLLRSVNGENPSGSAEPGKQADIRKDEMNTAKSTESENGFSEAFPDDEMDSDEMDFPELARLFEEVPEEEETAIADDDAMEESSSMGDTLASDSGPDIAGELEQDLAEAGGVEDLPEAETPAADMTEAGETVLVSQM